MAVSEVCGDTSINSSFMGEVMSSYNSHEDRNNLLDEVDRSPRSPNAIRPCFYILQILGMWKPKNGKFEFLWQVYRVFVYIVWSGCLASIMCLDFVHYGFNTKRIHFREVTNSACTCIDFLCPFVFTLYYFNRGQFVELVFKVQNVSHGWKQKLRRISLWYTLMSVILWVLCATFFMVHWFPFFSEWWHYAVYIPAVVYIAGWWATWLSIYGFVCHVHSLQIDTVIEHMRMRERRPISILRDHFELQQSIEKTQKDFTVIISMAVAYHILDLLVFSFAYFNSAFGSDYPIWQYVGTVLFDLLSIIFKLYPPALVAAASHRIVVEASKGCRRSAHLADLPTEDIQLFQYMALCEPDMGLKILGIRITVELTVKILMTIVTAGVSFIAFVIPRLK